MAEVHSHHRSARNFPETSPSDATNVDDTAIVRAYGDFKPAAAAPGVINQKPPAAIHPANFAEAAATQDSLASPARDRAASIEAGANRDVDRDRMSGRRKRYRRDKAHNQSQASEQRPMHEISP
ncbi:hypothetical protein ACSBOB_10555 [Mesorhizobium sp. ASY16-5R]|uniref:hypothetical protein n=1 Tax=Mesorhizobium sp. ASY16-5R TaxID=3445772 RepID=UPI003FA10F5D